MKQSHDPEQVTKPLDVARQAAWAGAGSGTYAAARLRSDMFKILLLCFPSLDRKSFSKVISCVARCTAQSGSYT